MLPRQEYNKVSNIKRFENTRIFETIHMDVEQSSYSFFFKEMYIFCAPIDYYATIDYTVNIDYRLTDHAFDKEKMA